MENHFRTPPASMDFLLLEEIQFLEVNDDALSQWEFVNVLDTEEAGETDNDGDRVQNWFGSWDSSSHWFISQKNGPIEGIHCSLLHAGVVMKDHQFDDDYNEERHFDGADDENGGKQVDDEEDEDNGYDLDDELVPWSVSGKFGRQRLRKLGKRACSKMYNSKWSPVLFVTPGSVRGKHGLGLKHNY